jgi:hypothetical protein
MNVKLFSWVYPVSVFLSVLYNIKDKVYVTIFMCHSWGMAVNTGLYVSFDNMQDWKRI